MEDDDEPHSDVLMMGEDEDEGSEPAEEAEEVLGRGGRRRPAAKASKVRNLLSESHCGRPRLTQLPLFARRRRQNREAGLETPVQVGTAAGLHANGSTSSGKASSISDDCHERSQGIGAKEKETA
jgi:hypothetical protein